VACLPLPAFVPHSRDYGVASSLRLMQPPILLLILCGFGHFFACPRTSIQSRTIGVIFDGPQVLFRLRHSWMIIAIVVYFSAMLEVNRLAKSYGKLIAVNGVSFRADYGETVGLLGPNGAGKTTIVSIIAGLVKPDSGEVLIESRQVKSDTDPVKLKIGLVPQDMALFEKLSARDNLRFFAALYVLAGARASQAINETLSLVGLSDRAGDKVETFSGGMKRRLNLAAALLHDPQILLLDEPTVGVDPQSRNAIFENLETLKNRGKTLLYTTHYMEEAERLCDRIVIIDHGKVIADDTLQGLHNLMPVTNIIAIELDDVDGVVPENILTLPEVKSAELEQNILRIGVHDLSRGAPGILRWLADNGHSYHHVSTDQPDLETVFLTLTGRSLRDTW
jgi:ABC-2 type transport system ATP-binding protein